jgi:hypothetical protein
MRHRTNPVDDVFTLGLFSISLCSQIISLYYDLNAALRKLCSYCCRDVEEWLAGISSKHGMNVPSYTCFTIIFSPRLSIRVNSPLVQPWRRFTVYDSIESIPVIQHCLSILESVGTSVLVGFFSISSITCPSRN